MKGRRPIPTSLHVLHGLPGKRPLNADEPQPERGIPDPPAHLSEGARAAWPILAQKLDDMAVLTLADSFALEQLSENHAEILEWRKLVKDAGHTYEVTNDEGETRILINPACRMLSDAEKRFRSMLVEFGLTPSSRSKVNAKPGSKEKPKGAKRFLA